jgi:hypothetical protein
MQTPQSVPAAKLLALQFPAPSQVSAPEHDVTALLPQALPGALFPPSTHTDAPVVQDVTPDLQLLGFVVQARPAVQALHTPVLQTRLVPQLVPSARDVPVSPQTALPVVQESVPVWQVLLGVHDWPLLHVVQVPALQTMLVPQDVPPALFPLSTQTCDPVEHDVVPSLQGLPGWQALPAVQETHCPVLQTRFVPHDVPSESEVFASTHVDAPVLQLNVPAWQGLAGVQLPPAVQVMHAPPEHTLLVPQDVPFGAFPDATQVEMPVEHDVVPVLQGSLGWQDAPAVHAMQAPPLQTWPVPQAVPSVRFWLLSPQLMLGEQLVVPVWHGLAGVQLRPDVQATQAPPLHTFPVPHGVPFWTFPVSRQTGAPVLQTVMPVRQALPVTAQLAPAAQETQLPLALQTMSVPHAVPAATFVELSLQVMVVPQASVPLWHAFAGTHASPFAHVLHVPD